MLCMRCLDSFRLLRVLFPLSANTKDRDQRSAHESNHAAEYIAPGSAAQKKCAVSAVGNVRRTRPGENRNDRSGCDGKARRSSGQKVRDLPAPAVPAQLFTPHDFLQLVIRAVSHFLTSNFCLLLLSGGFYGFYSPKFRFSDKKTPLYPKIKRWSVFSALFIGPFSPDERSECQRSGDRKHKADVTRKARF